MLTATVLATVALVVALAALVQARRSARQLARLTEMYWQLKYDHGELKAALAPPPESPPVSGFVPLGSVKRNPSS
jgi:hypothetical protein